MAKGRGASTKVSACFSVLWVLSTSRTPKHVDNTAVCRNFGETDCPKNAHLIPEWENMEEMVELQRRANATSIIDEGDLASLMRVATMSNRDFTACKQNTRVVYEQVGLGAQVVDDASTKEAIPDHLNCHKKADERNGQSFVLLHMHKNAVQPFTVLGRRCRPSADTFSNT